MGMIKKSALALATVFGLILAAPAGAASAGAPAVQQSDASATYTSNCPTGLVVSLANNLPIRTKQTLSSTIVDTVHMGWGLQCRQNSYWLGDRYTACGVSQANGWISVWVAGYGWGYTYMTCLEDLT